mgnify:CR=1 FL=1
MDAILTSQLGESRYLKAESASNPTLIIHYTECNNDGAATDAEMHANLAGMYAVMYNIFTATNYFIGAKIRGGYAFTPNDSTLFATKHPRNNGNNNEEKKRGER